MKFPFIHVTPKWRRILFRVGLIIIFAYILTFFLETRHFLNDTARTWQFIEEKRLVFRYSVAIMGLTLTFLSALFRKPWTSIGLVTAIIIIVGYIHIAKFEHREMPLLPEDFLLADQAGTVASFVDFWSIARTILAVILVVVLTIALNHITEKFLPNNRKTSLSWVKRNNIALRIVVMSVATVGLLVTTDFVRHQDGERYMDAPWLDTYFMAWNQRWNYDTNGFILGFLYNLDKFKLHQPAGYSEEKIKEIAEKYMKIKNKDIERQPVSETDYNIIVILNESFYDPSIIRDYYRYDGDVTPELHQIEKQTSSGQMYSLDYGGGTANIEFEAFTGLSNYWADTVPYTSILPKIDRVQSIASFTKAGGYRTTAIHPYNGGMYKRDFALMKQGFDKFITEKEMEFMNRRVDANGEPFGEVTDQSSYEQVLKVVRDSDERQMIGLITMLNHAPYVAEWYEKLQFPVELVGQSPEETDEIELAKTSAFLEVLHRSDADLGEFIDKLNAFDEKTVVLFYGDHAPGVFSRVIGDEEQKISDLARVTPYFIYANFDLPIENLPMTTPNCIGNTMYNLLNLEKPTLGYLLDQICTQTPILSPFYLGETGPFQSTELSEYELINYDVLGGEQYWYKYTNEN